MPVLVPGPVHPTQAPGRVLGPARRPGAAEPCLLTVKFELKFTGTGNLKLRSSCPEWVQVLSRQSLAWLCVLVIHFEHLHSKYRPLRASDQSQYRDY